MRKQALLLFVGVILISACGTTPAETPAPTQTPTPTATQPPVESTEPPEEPTATTAPTLDGAALLQERCTVCHDLGRVEAASMTEAEWLATVDRMIERGAVLGEEERLVLIGYLAETYGAKIDAQALLQERCTVCHSLSRVEAKTESLEEWREIVERMIGRGAVLNAEEEQALIEYLAETYPE